MKHSSPFAIAALIIANLIPLAGVLWLGWDIKYLVLSYWFENLVVGAYAILRILTAQGNMKLRTPTSIGMNIFLNLLMVLFFIAHYGGFCGGHGFFLLALTSGLGGEGTGGPSINSSMHDWPGPLVFVGMLVGVVQAIFAERPPGIWMMLGGLAISHGVSFFTNYLGKGEYLKTTVTEEMSQPYKRIVILHIAIIAAGMPVMMLKSPLPLLILIIIGKIGLDLWLHLREHRKAGERTKSAGS